MERIVGLLRQYRYGVLVLLIGLGLMLVPTEQETDASVDTSVEAESVSLQRSLEQILSRIDGAGEVCVLLTESAGETVHYQHDTNASGDSRKEETVVITGADRSETGLVSQIIPPRYQGAVVVCQGGDRASVRLAIVEAVSSVTGLTSDKITVLKMK